MRLWEMYMEQMNKMIADLAVSVEDNRITTILSHYYTKLLEIEQQFQKYQDEMIGKQGFEQVKLHTPYKELNDLLNPEAFKK